MCKHCNNANKLHYHYIRTEFNPFLTERFFERMNDDALDRSMLLNDAMKNPEFAKGLVAYNHYMQGRAIKHAYTQLTGTHLSHFIQVIEQYNILRSGLTLLQAKMALSDDQNLKKLVDDILSQPFVEWNINDLKKDLSLLTH